MSRLLLFMELRDDHMLEHQHSLVRVGGLLSLLSLPHSHNNYVSSKTYVSNLGSESFTTPHSSVHSGV